MSAADGIETGMPAAGGNPFSLRGVLLLVLFGTVVFVALLWMIGAGMTQGSTNDGGSHAGGKGLNGYAALAGFLERRGNTVRRAQNESALDDPGLLVLTPPQWTDGAELERIVSARRYAGPTIVIVPKWLAAPAPASAKGAKQGWVTLGGTAPPQWQGFYDDITVDIRPAGDGKAASWSAGSLSGRLPDARAVMSGSSSRLAPLAVSRPDGRILAAFVVDSGSYPELEAIALSPPRRAGEEDTDIYPLVMVFEPDLFDNYGMADKANALLAERLFRAAGDYSDGTVIFDLTLNGFARSTNLLTLAFTPPFLAATLCLLLAALVVGWRAFLRFGPPARAARAIAFGKRQLVSNAAGLVNRSRRFHLVSHPYVARARKRIAELLALPRQRTPEATDAAIDRAVAARLPDQVPFSILARRLAAKRRPADVLAAARELHALERKLSR